MIDAILDQLKAITDPMNRMKVILKDRDTVPAMPGARALVELAKLAARASKVAGELLEALNTTPPLPGIEVAEEDGAA